MSEKIHLKGELVHREVTGEHILIPVGETALKLSGMVCVSESGMLLWERLKQGATQAELAEALLETYEVDRADAEADVEQFLAKLRELELV